MKSVLFLTHKISFGFGVDVVVINLANELKKRGVACCIGALSVETANYDLDIAKIGADVTEIKNIASRLPQPCVIVAHTSPFFEALPDLCVDYKCYAWEHGDPSPEFFYHDKQDRINIKNFKEDNVYGACSGVIAISDFIRHDIGFPEAKVIYNGCDHIPPFPPKDLNTFRGRRLRVGTLMRLGSGEAQYKGSELVLKLKELLDQSELVDFELHIAGRGSDEDAESYRKAGVQAHLNLTETEKIDYLRGLDVFFSFSLWEGFNLPLVEAQRLGTASFALDTGAHPEVCPFIIGSVGDLIKYLRFAVGDREWLSSVSNTCREFVNSRFTWANTTDAFLDHV